jgi:hypothetical protein
MRQRDVGGYSRIAIARGWFRVRSTPLSSETELPGFLPLFLRGLLG